MWREGGKNWRRGGDNGSVRKIEQAKARDNLTILSLASRSGEVVTSRSFTACHLASWACVWIEKAGAQVELALLDLHGAV